MTSDEILTRLTRIEESLEQLKQQLGSEPEPAKPRTEYLSLSQAAKETGLSYATLRRAIHRGHLRAFNIGVGSRRPVYRIQREDVEQFLSRKSTQNEFSQFLGL